MDVSDISQKVQDFQDGKLNISKKDLTEQVQAKIASGENPTSAEIDLIDSYEKIDTNGDGISKDELAAYQATPEGLLSSMGISKQSLINSSTSLNSGILNSFNSDSTSSYQQILSNYYSSNTNDEYNDNSILDYLS